MNLASKRSLRQGTGNWRGIPLRARPQVCRQVPGQHAQRWVDPEPLVGQKDRYGSPNMPKEGTMKGRWTMPVRASRETWFTLFRKPRGKRLCRPGLPRANALLWAKRKADEKGIASIDLKGLSGHQRLHVFAVDAWAWPTARYPSLPPNSAQGIANGSRTGPRQTILRAETLHFPRQRRKIQVGQCDHLQSTGLRFLPGYTVCFPL